MRWLALVLVVFGVGASAHTQTMRTAGEMMTTPSAEPGSSVAADNGKAGAGARATPDAAAAKPTSTSPVSVTVYDRTRVETWQWFAATPHAEVYPYVESLLRIGVAQRIKRFDWQLELSQPSLLGLPNDAVSPVTAQGQLGLGGTYYVSNFNNRYPAAAFLKQGFVRYRYGETGNAVRVGRFEFFDGQETQPKDKTLAWLQTNRIAQRLVGNFGFSNAQRSFDGVDAHLARGSWELTGMAARADKGVYNMNGNGELNTDIQYLAYSRHALGDHLLARGFALGYHDGRTGVVKTDNRALAVRQRDHQNIRIGSYGADVIATVPAGAGSFDLLGWGVLQNGQWGALNHHAGAAAGEAGYKFAKAPTVPWIRGGFFRSTGDNNPADNQHNTFFQVLPTPRGYARFPFFNLMNNKDQFVQVLDKPTKKLDLRTDLHFLQLTSKSDLWYQGGGAFDSLVFGFQGRPANSRTSFATLYDVSADYQATSSLLLTAYYAHAWGKSVVAAIYPVDRSAQFGYVELVYRWGLPQRAAPSK